MSRDPETVSYNMSRIKSKDTSIEVRLRKELWQRGLRYRKNSKKVFGKPDIVFVSKKIAVFCDSEFWHGHDWENRKNDFKKNQDFWIPKIERNIQREVSHYKSTSFFVIRKVDNKSTIVPCVRPSRIAGEEENYNPVQNSYAALWDELKKLYKEDRASIAIKNVSRRIIDQYFLQLCGFEGADIRRIVLEENKAKFVTEIEGGKPNYEKYHLASALLHYVSSPSGIGDEMFIDDECVDSETHRTVFQLIFEAMHQDQHYNMMMAD